MKIDKVLTISMLVILLSITSANAAGMRIAVMNFKTKKISQAEANNVTELIRNEIIGSNKFIVLERDQVDAILIEQGFQQTGCTDTSCAVKVGKMLSARKILIGSIMKMGKKIIITGRIVDIESGTAEFSGKASAKSESQLDTAVTAFTNKLVENIEKRESEIKAKQAEREEELAREAELKKLAEEERTKNRYFLPLAGGALVTAASLGGGYYFDRQIISKNDECTALAKKYNLSTNETEAQKLHKDMESTREDAERNSLYRNLSYGIGIASTLATAYFIFKYMTYTPDAASPVQPLKNSGRKPFIVPLCFAGADTISGSSTEGHFFGGGLVLSF